MKKKLYILLNILAFILIIIFAIRLRIDWLNYYEYMSTPFYIYIIYRLLEFVLPACILLIIGHIIIKKNK